MSRTITNFLLIFGCILICNFANAQADGNITLTVDMSQYSNSFTTVYISGGFNGWSGDSNPMTDNGDGTWTGTVFMTGGDQEYKFQVDQWADEESFAGGESCTVTNSGFTNRVVSVDGDATVDPVCFDSCDPCTAATDGMITLSVDMSEYSGSFSQVYLSGSYNGWSGDSNPMTDNGDGTFSITVMMPAGDNTYKFTIDNWAVQEWFNGGESCTITNGDFTDRYLFVNGDATVDVVCFESCFECGAMVDGNITLTVDMSEYANSFTTMYISGTFNGWSGDANPMTDNGDGTWSVTLMMPAGDNEYKFQVDQWTDEEFLNEGDLCTVTNSGFTNRYLHVNGDATVDVVCFESCFACGAAADGMVTFTVDMSDYASSFTTVYLSGAFNGWSGDANPMTDNGDGTWTGTVLMTGGDNQYKFQLDQWDVEEDFVGGEPCTITDSGFTNRYVFVDGDASVDAVCFNSCFECGFVEAQQKMPITFEEPDTISTYFGFGGVEPLVVGNPDMSGENTSATVMQLTKIEGAETWGGTAIPLDCPIDFFVSSVIEMKVWSPRADVPFLLKIEDSSSGNPPTIFAEVTQNTTVANAWETLMFDMATFMDFDPMVNNYNQVVIFPDFGANGAVGGESFYVDNIMVGGDVGVDAFVLENTNLNVYPNPVDEVLYAEFDLPVSGNATIQIVDILGKINKHIDAGNLTEGAYIESINLGHLNPGLYTVLLSLDNQAVKTKTIVVY